MNTPHLHPVPQAVYTLAHICNTSDWLVYKSSAPIWQMVSRYRATWYALKAWYLRTYGTFDGYDYQRYRKYCYFRRDYDGIYTTHHHFDWEAPVAHELGHWDYDQEDGEEYFNSDYPHDLVNIKWTSDHEHILERWKFCDEAGNSHVWHLPTNEHRYSNWKGIDRTTDRFIELLSQCRPEYLGSPKELTRNLITQDRPLTALGALKELIKWGRTFSNSSITQNSNTP